MEANWVEYHNTQLQYYLGIQQPSQLSDEEWALKIRQLEDIRKKEAGK